MSTPFINALRQNFLGQAPNWYKKAIIAFLIINPLVFFLIDPFLAGWLLIAEFIFTLALALKCYPLQPGGLLAIEAIAIGMSTPDKVYHEALVNFEVILLLIFMVAGIYFMKNLLLFIFSRILLGVRSKATLSLLMSLVAAFLSAFLDALTVTAVVISVGIGFYSVYHKVASGKNFHHDDHDHGNDNLIDELKREDLAKFRAFLRSLLMHASVGTALGGVCTLVGEPQNLLIAEKAGWDFQAFFTKMAPVTMPVLMTGLFTCYLLEKTKSFGYGAQLSETVRIVLQEYTKSEDEKRTAKDKAALMVQAIAGVLLVVGLATHVATVGLIGLAIIVLLTAFTGIIEEHQIGKAFEEALPFTALLVVLFAIVSVIHEQHLFAPITNAVLSLDPTQQPAMIFIANGVLSMISDNVFVATVYIDEVKSAFDQGTISRELFEKLAIAVNTGTNIPSIATPNGQAAFLFLLTSTLAPLLRLSYGTMVWMALPYTITMGLVGFACVSLFV